MDITRATQLLTDLAFTCRRLAFNTGQQPIVTWSVGIAQINDFR